MIKKIKQTLASAAITEYRISEEKETRHELYYALQKPYMSRATEDVSYWVTVYVRGEGMGASSFIAGPNTSAKELNEKIATAKAAAQLGQKPPYELIAGEKKRFRQVLTKEEPFAFLEKVAGQFFAPTTPTKKFNSLELFLIDTQTKLINSRGIEYQSNSQSLAIEAIPSYDGEKPEDPVNAKVELYKQYNYYTYDPEQIDRDVATALADVEARFASQKFTGSGQMDVLLRAPELSEMIEALLGELTYTAVFTKQSTKAIGAPYVAAPKGDKLTLALHPLNKALRFDRDGVILEKLPLIKSNKIESFFGSSQYAQYLGTEPKGAPGMIVLKAGTRPAAELKSEECIEVAALSWLQVDVKANYIGGEVRLGLYHKDGKTLPISGFAFSAQLSDVLATMRLSKEQVTFAKQQALYNFGAYKGPQYIKLHKVNVL